MTTPQFFEWLYDTCDGGKLEVRTDAGERAWADLGRWHLFDAFVARAVTARRNVFFSLATRKDASHGGAGNIKLPRSSSTPTTPQPSVDA